MQDSQFCISNKMVQQPSLT